MMRTIYHRIQHPVVICTNNSWPDTIHLYSSNRHRYNREVTQRGKEVTQRGKEVKKEEKEVERVKENPNTVYRMQDKHYFVSSNKGPKQHLVVPLGLKRQDKIQKHIGGDKQIIPYAVHDGGALQEHHVESFLDKVKKQ